LPFKVESGKNNKNTTNIYPEINIVFVSCWTWSLGSVDGFVVAGESATYAWSIIC